MTQKEAVRMAYRRATVLAEEAKRKFDEANVRFKDSTAEDDVDALTSAWRRWSILHDRAEALRWRAFDL